MIIAMHGAQGTGKTTLIDYIKERHKEVVVISDSMRVLVRDILQQSSREYISSAKDKPAAMVAFFSAVIGAVVLQKYNADEVYLLDHTPVTLYAHYKIVAKEMFGEIIENTIIERMVSQFQSKIDYSFYFPIGKFKLVSDGIRPDSVEIQTQWDTEIVETLKEHDDAVHVFNVIPVQKRYAQYLSCINVKL